MLFVEDAISALRYFKTLLIVYIFTYITITFYNYNF